MQGVGFRPFVAALALELGLMGWVRNSGPGVEISLLGGAAALKVFAERLRLAPAPARVENVMWRRVPFRAMPRSPVPPIVSHPRFIIRPSRVSAPFRFPIPPDLGPCAACLSELHGTGRRAAYPFTSCAHCGPRFTIVSGVPFDRIRTSMAGFSMCPDCATEYNSPGDRRAHAQTICCPVCGPRLWLRDSSGQTLQTPMDTALSALREGKILAMKGIGGWQLLVDARNEAAVARLRERKHRPRQPFAVLVSNLGTAQQLADLSALEVTTILGPAAPILLLSRHDDLAVSVAPGQSRLGLMLPASPLHALIAADGPLVCTSGNLHEEPICRDDADAYARLALVADLFLGHDRPVLHQADDPVLQVVAGEARCLRLGRGVAPLRLSMPMARRPLWAMGAHYHVAPGVAHAGEALLWPQIGNMGSPAARRALDETFQGIRAFFPGVPEKVVVDAHPDYASTRYAETLGFPLLRVWHHHAHVAACLAEYGEERALGVAWDGTGLGPDGTAWGGEFLQVGPEGARRVASMRGFPLPGGDAAARDGRRVWAGLCAEIGLDDGEARFRALAPFAPRTSSVGRLFDAVAARLGLCALSSFQGEAAMALEAEAQEDVPYPFFFRDNILDWEPMIRSLHVDAPFRVPGRFHATLVAMILEVVERENAPVVALVGGCFQNRKLLMDTMKALEGRKVLVPRWVPPGDGGLALGQLWIAAYGL